MGKRLFFTASDSPSAQLAKDTICRIRELQANEDKTICELAQRNLRSTFYDTGQLSPDSEQDVLAFQRSYAHFMT
jgi:hypothetical protein